MSLKELISELDIVLTPDALDYLKGLSENAEELLRTAASNSESFVITKEMLADATEKIRVKNKALEFEVSPSEQFNPIAKNVKSQLKILDKYDVSNKSLSVGNINDFLLLFRNRMERIRKILKGEGHISKFGIVKVSDIKQFAVNRAARVIVMIREKKITKNGHILLIVEDETGTLNALSIKSTASFEDANELIEDEVVALDGHTSNSLFIVDSITWPDIKIEKRKKKVVPVDVNIAFLSDLHIGSKYFREEDFIRFLKFLNGEGGEKQKAGKIKYIIIAGDLVDGIGIYPTQEEQLTTKNIYTQYEIFSEYIKKIPDYIEVVISPGNHDAVRLAEPQPHLGEEFTAALSDKKNVHFVSNPAWLEIHGLKILVYHGTSIDTWVSRLPSLRRGYENPEKIGIEMLKRRHLSPFYGDKPLAPEHFDYMLIDEVPDILHFGHVHKNAYGNYRGVLIINSGTFQGITDYQVKQGHVPTPAQVPIYNIASGKIETLNFSEENL